MIRSRYDLLAGFLHRHRLHCALEGALTAGVDGAAQLPAMVPDQRRAIIVVGMHRSGTSIVSRTLEALGVHMGGDTTTENHESEFFLDRNDAMLAVAGGSWDWPNPFVDWLRADHENRAGTEPVDACARVARAWLTSTQARSYWKGHRGETHQFGWKEPRNSITWPIWHRVFPNALWINVERDDAAVVASLVTRSQRILGQRTWKSWRALDPHQCSSLHAEYRASIGALRSRIDADSFLTIQYADLVADPVAVLDELTTAGVGDPSRVDAAASLVRRRAP